MLEFFFFTVVWVCTVGKVRRTCSKLTPLFKSAVFSSWYLHVILPYFCVFIGFTYLFASPPSSAEVKNRKNLLSLRAFVACDRVKSTYSFICNLRVFIFLKLGPFVVFDSLNVSGLTLKLLLYYCFWFSLLTLWVRLRSHIKSDVVYVVWYLFRNLRYSYVRVFTALNDVWQA